MKNFFKKNAFSLIELSIVILVIGIIVGAVVLGSSSLNTKAKCLEGVTFKSVQNNLDDVNALTANKSAAYENCVNPPPPETSCKVILQKTPGSASGVYTIKPDGASSSFSAYCDMTTDGGGWTLVLNYLHKGGTNPLMAVKIDKLPIQNSTSLGTDESSSTTSWGHASNSLMNKFSFTEIRFYGKTSDHSRIVNYKINLASCISYFKTGTGRCGDEGTSGATTVKGNSTLLSGHTANLPQGIPGTGGYVNWGDYAMTNGPADCAFGSQSCYRIKAWGCCGDATTGSMWAVDNSAGTQNDTLHQIWIR